MAKNRRHSIQQAARSLLVFVIRILPLIGICLFLLGAVPSRVSARSTYYVSPNGVDSQDHGTSPDRAWKTIAYALKNVPDNGSTILVADGTYEAPSGNRAFSMMMTIKAMNPYKARFHKCGIMGQNITVEGFEIFGLPGDSAIIWHLWSGETRNFIIRNNILHDSYSNDILKINAGRDISVIGNVFYNQSSNDEHIDINHVTDIEVTDNIFFNDYSGSDRTNPGSTNVVVIKNSGNNLPGGARNINFRRNIFLNWDGEVWTGFLRFGEDPGEHIEFDGSIIENNLFLGTSEIDFSGNIVIRDRGKNITIRNNTFYGDHPGRAFAFNIHAGATSSGLNVFNNIIADPTGTMDIPAGGTVWPDVITDQNLYWNNEHAIPYAENDLIYKNDANKTEVDPKLNPLGRAILPRWLPSQGRFISGNGTIREEFIRLVGLYGAVNNGSPAINSANKNEAPLDDILGNVRDNSPDVGCFEFGKTSFSFDTTPPSAPTGLQANPRSTSQIDLSWSAATDPESPIAIYVILRDGEEIGTSIDTRFSDVELADNTPYRYEVSAVIGTGLEGPLSQPVIVSTLLDDTPPFIEDVIANGNPTGIWVRFSEPVDVVGAETLENYQLDHGIGIAKATLESDSRTVMLITDSPLSEGAPYTLTVDNITDRATSPNPIAPGSSYSFVPQLFITNTSVKTGKVYEWDILEIGKRAYIDRSIIFRDIPMKYRGLAFLRTANDDKWESSDPFITFDIQQPVTVFISYASALMPNRPAWLSEDAGWQLTGDALATTDRIFKILSKDFKPGTISLGGNVCSTGAGGSMYNVFVAYEVPEPIDGDLNQDGVIDQVDVQICTKVILGFETDFDIVRRADLNNDGEINALDLQEIVATYLGEYP